MEYSLYAGTPAHQFGSPLLAEGALRPGDADTASQQYRYGAMTAEVSAFLAQLRRTPVDAWRHAAETDGHIGVLTEVGVEARAGGPSLGGRDADQRARARLRELMDTMPDVVRRIRTSIEHDLSILEGIAAPPVVAHMRRAARLAACSIAARQFLAPEEFARLYRPFTALIPFHPQGDG